MAPTESPWELHVTSDAFEALCSSMSAIRIPKSTLSDTLSVWPGVDIAASLLVIHLSLFDTGWLLSLALFQKVADQPEPHSWRHRMDAVQGHTGRTSGGPQKGNQKAVKVFEAHSLRTTDSIDSIDAWL